MKLVVRVTITSSGLALVTAGILIACVGDSGSTSPTEDSGAADSSVPSVDGTVAPVLDAATTDGTPPLAPCSALPWPSAGGQVVGVDTSFNELNVSLTGDTLSMFFSRGTGTDVGVYEAFREASTSFVTPSRLTDVLATSNGSMLPSVSANGLVLYAQYRTTADGGVALEGGSGNADAAADLTFNIYSYSRADTASPWIGPTPIDGINTSANEVQPSLSADGNTLYFASDRGTDGGVLQIYQATKSGGTFGSATLIAGLAPAGVSVTFPVVNAAGTKLFYAAPPVGVTTGEDDIWMATRPNADALFGTPAIVVELSTPSDDRPGFISPDECRFYFTTRYNSVANDFDVWLSKKR